MIKEALTFKNVNQKKNKDSLGLEKKKKKDKTRGTSLVVQWLRIRLPMQGTRV